MARWAVTPRRCWRHMQTIPRSPGLPRYEAAKLNEMAKERVLAGFQLGFHAIGDKGVQMALDAFAEAEKACVRTEYERPERPQRFRLRIEHAQVTTPAQIARFKELKVIASMQPSHLLTDMRWAQDRLGPKRAATSYAWAAFLNKGVTLAFGTDYPVEPVSPFRGLYAAVTRKSENGKQEYFPEQKLTMDQAIAAYTTGSAFAEFEEKEKGKLAPGMLADFVVLDHDVTATSAGESADHQGAADRSRRQDGVRGREIVQSTICPRLFRFLPPSRKTKRRNRASNGWDRAPASHILGFLGAGTEALANGYN